MAADYAGVCLEYITLRDGSVMCVKELADLGEGWNCCSTSTNECVNDANVVTYKDPDGSTTTVVHCGGGYYPVFCQGSSIGLICSTTN